MAIFNPAQLPNSNQDSFSSHGTNEIKLSAALYGEEVEIKLFDIVFKSPEVLDGDGQWPTHWLISVFLILCLLLGSF